MSVPPWRPPPPPQFQPEPKYVVVVLSQTEKRLVSSDYFHGILRCGFLFRCAFCQPEIPQDYMCKEIHKTSENHRKMLETYPLMQGFHQHLIRQIAACEHYCTYCNVVIASNYIYKHIETFPHTKREEISRLQGYIINAPSSNIVRYYNL